MPDDMDDNNLKPGETKPMPLNDQSTNHPDLEQTIPTNVTSHQEETLEAGDTIALSSLTELEEPPDFGETMSSNVQQEPEAPTGYEATIPPPLEPGSEVPSLDEDEIKKVKSRKLKIRLLIIGGIIGLILIAILSGFGGYFSGIRVRTNAEKTQQAIQVQEQLQLAAQDILDKEYFRARQRLEYIIQVDPNYPGVTEMLAQVLLEMNITASPTPVPTPTVTPTPDIRGAEEKFSQAQNALFQNDWNSAIISLLSLKKSEPDYKPILVDGMLYTAYRNRGRDKILKDGDLEGGIYDLTLAERFGPLDADSKSYLTWARIYILGASFWDVDWSQAVYYFGQVAPALPNLRDGSGWTATERYRLALVNYGDYLAARKEWCAAMQQYEQALAYGSNGDLQQKYQQAIEKCEGPKPTQAPPEGEQPPTEEEPPAEEPTPTEEGG